MIAFQLTSLLALLPVALALSNSSIASTKATSVTLLYQNNLNVTDHVNHMPFLVLDHTAHSDASAACASFGETLLSDDDVKRYASDIKTSLGYLAHAGQRPYDYYVKSGILTFAPKNQSLSMKSATIHSRALPVLCTQSQGNSTATASNEIMVTSNTNTFIGYRDQKSFRFLGIPYADSFERFEYSSPYSKQHQTVQATQQGSQCAQGGSGEEDCLFLSIYTPYLPKSDGSSDAATLKPVFFWIHGGGFTGGAGSASEGGDLASREDIIYVSINYRLSTLGFLAVPGTDIKGNYGIADQITALEWTRANIKAFGGDPDKITIVGESAGAGSVRTLLGSPPAIGKFRGGIAMSNLGGGVTLGLESDYSTTYSSYLTIEESDDITKDLFTQAGCNQTTISAKVECIKKVDALKLVGLSTVARYVVQDGTIVNTEQLIVSEKNASTAHVPVMFGVMADDGSSVIQYPSSPVEDESSGLQTIMGISPYYAESVISSGLFPFPNTGNLTLDTFNVSSRLYTDAGFRCIDQATLYAGLISGAFPSAYFYEFDRSIGGYDPNNVGNPPPSPGYPLGNPSLPYFKVHAGDVASAFGSVSADQIREPQDLWFAQLISGYFAEFVRSLQPNPDHAYLTARGYWETLTAVQKSGDWQAVEKGSLTGPTLAFDWPPTRLPFRETEQCTWLNYTLSYYLDSNRG